MDEQRKHQADYLAQLSLYARYPTREPIIVPRRAGKATAAREAHEYWSTVLHERVERHQATLPAAPERAVCDGWGLVTIPSPDGPEHYSCHGCRSCRPVVPLAPAADPFARLPEVPSDDDLEM